MKFEVISVMILIYLVALGIVHFLDVSNITEAWM